MAIIKTCLPNIRLALIVVAIAAMSPASRASSSSGATATPAAYVQLHSFANTTDGANPSSLILATDGNFYGTASNGGPTSQQPQFFGTFFKMTPAGVVTFLQGFTLGALAPRALIQGTDGNFYVSVGFFGAFTQIVKLTANGAFEGLPSIHLVDPEGLLEVGQTLYVLDPGQGMLFGLNLATTPPTSTTVHVFQALTDGSSPTSLVNINGVLYGTTATGGDSSGVCPTSHCDGTVFKMNPDGTGFTVLHAFPSSPDIEGRQPKGTLVNVDGVLYGTTSVGGSLSGGSPGAGTVFSMHLDGTAFTTLHTFAGGTDGATPLAALVQGFGGMLFGTTSKGGPSDAGTVFEMSPAGEVTILHAFTGTNGDGAFPATSLVKGADGSLYGTTRGGGASGDGTAFKIIPQGLRANIASYDVDGDGKSDLTVFRPSSGVWFTLPSSTNFTSGITATAFGVPGDLPVLGDYDGDGTSDRAVYRPATGTWFVQLSNGVTQSIPWGIGTDVPVPGDYDGDRRADLAVYRPSTGQWLVLTSSSGYAGVSVTQWGLSTDIAVPADYDGDGKTDLAVFRPSTGQWLVRTSSTGGAFNLIQQWGLPGDIPVPGDFDGDGKTDLAVFRPSVGTWFISQSTTNFIGSVSYQWGLAGDVPAPADYDGDGKADIAVFRPATGTWFIKQSTTGFSTFSSFQWGLASDVVVPNVTVARATIVAKRTVSSGMRTADLDGDGRADVTVFRPSTGEWVNLRSGFNYSTAAVFTGHFSDIPVPNDFDGDGQTDVAVFFPATGWWDIRTSTSYFVSVVSYQWGLSGDVPVPGDYDGDGRADLAVFRPGNGSWYILKSSSHFTTSISYQWGLTGDVPVPGDFDGDGTTDLAVFRPGSGEWFVLKSSSNFTVPVVYQWGLNGDVPIPGDFDGDGVEDLAVFRPSNAGWFILNSSSHFTIPAVYQWGLNGDTPVPGDFDGDGRLDLGVFRPSTNTWFVLTSGSGFTSALTLQWGLAGDVPILRRQ